MKKRAVIGMLMMTVGLAWFAAHASAGDPRQLVAMLDSEYQSAVKANDAQTMGRILHKEMILVHGDGTSDSRAELLQEARDKILIYEHQEEDPGTQTVRVWGDTAVVTARLWVKGVSKGRVFNRRLWFSDTYVRTREGWRYAFGQASLHLPDADG
jgi:ketosteroid isomerase-like protein